MSAILVTQLEQSQIDELLQYVSEYSDSNFDSIRRKCLAKIHSGNIINITDNNSISSHKRINKKWIIIAAVIATLLLVAATFFSISDLFRGVLKEQNSTGDITPISSMTPIVEKSGKLIAETVSDNDIDVTVRGVVGSAEGFKMLIDIGSSKNKPIAILQDDGSYSQGDLTFGTIIVTGETEANTRMLHNPYENYWTVNIDFGEFGGTAGIDLKTLEFNPDNNKATLLLDVSVSGHQTPLAGQTIKLELGNLMQKAYMPGTQIGMQAGDLQKLLNQFNSVFPGDFEEKGYYNDPESHARIPRYILAENSDNRVPLADYFPDVMLTNMALHEDILYFRYTSPEDADLRKLINNIGLVNQRTGEAAQIMLQGNLMPPSDDGMLDWHMSFKLPDSTKNINDYAFVVDYGEGDYPLTDGTWEFTIPLDYKNTTRIIDVNMPVTIRNVQPTATTLTISPYYLALQATSEDEEILNHISAFASSPEELKERWEEYQKKAVMTMKDGSVVEAVYGGSYGQIGECLIIFSMDIVIDPEQVEIFEYGDLVVQLNKQ